MDQYFNKAEIIPIWHKYALTIEEAAKYFRIGENKLREMVDDSPSADWVLWNGNRALIKRTMFEKNLDNTNTI